MEQDIRLTYAAASNQVRVSFPVELVREERKPPKDLYKRAKAKLTDELGKGNIETFVLYESAFNQYWSHLRDLDELGDKTSIFCIAQGYRKYKDILLQPSSHSGEWTITLRSGPETLSKIGWARFAAYIQQQIGIEPYTKPSVQLRILECYWRALRGEKIQNRLLAALPLDSDLPPLKFAQDKIGGTIMVWIGDKDFIQAPGHKKLFTQVQAFLDKHKASLTSYVPLLKECQEQLKELVASPESFGFGLPFGMPIAVKNLQTETAKQPDEVSSPSKDIFKKIRSQAKVAEKPKAASTRLIEIQISPDGLEADISWANDATLQAGKYDQDRKWLDEALKEAGICYGHEAFVEKVLSLVTLGQSIQGQPIARGREPKGGDQIYIHPLYLERTISETEDVIDLRSVQNRKVMESGDVIAELRYRDGKAGMNVFGKALHMAAKHASYKIEAGPGAERREDGRFYSLLRGMPKIERNLISCVKVYVHRGDVNLKSGDINFDGAVEVRGSIDNGARVFAEGDIIVRGGIGRARVKCRGDLSVSKGIITSREGMVHAGGDVTALFIENSRMVVEGQLEVEQSIVNSDCKVAGEIIVKSSAKGMLGGGILVSGQGIRTQDLGFQDGEKTICRVGSDWRLEHRISILKVREAKLKRFVSDRQYEFDDWTKKKMPAERLEKSEKRLIRGKKIHSRIEELIDKTQSKIRWNSEAIMIVRGIADTNTEVVIGGRTVSVQENIKEVFFTSTRYRDQFINSLIYLEQYRKGRVVQGDAI